MTQHLRRGTVLEQFVMRRDKTPATAFKRPTNEVVHKAAAAGSETLGATPMFRNTSSQDVRFHSREGIGRGAPQGSGVQGSGAPQGLGARRPGVGRRPLEGQRSSIRRRSRVCICVSCLNR